MSDPEAAFMSPVKRRDRLPVCRLPEEETRVLYQRYSSLKHKAVARNVYFPWPKFADYLAEVLENAPSDYAPSKFRISHGSGFEFGKGKMRFSRKGGEPHPSYVIAELTALLLTLDGDLDELAQAAEMAAAA